MPKSIKLKTMRASVVAPFKTKEGSIIFLVINNRKVARKLNLLKGSIKHVITYNKEQGIICTRLTCEKPPYFCELYCFPDQLVPAIQPEAKMVSIVDENFIKKTDITAEDIKKLKLLNLTNDFRIALKKIKKETDDDTAREDTSESEGSAGMASTESAESAHETSDTTSDSSGTSEGKEKSTE